MPVFPEGSKTYLVGDTEREWDQETEMVDVCGRPKLGGAEAPTVAIPSSTTPVVGEKQPASSPHWPMETFTLEPPPQTIFGSHCALVTSFVSLGDPFRLGSSRTDFLQLFDHNPGGILGVQIEELMVSAEFDVV